MNTLIPASVLVIESHSLMREALYAAIAGEPDLMVAAQAVNCTEVLNMVVTVNPGQAVLAFKPDIILLTLGNPGMVEMETLKALRKALPDTPILALTADEVPGQGQAALTAGAQAVLGKSAARAELIGKLRELSLLRQVPFDPTQAGLSEGPVVQLETVN
jgi:two-component system nitrate/nitrite response regulator NarL